MPTTRVHDAVDTILHKILQGTFHPHQPLPSEHELAQLLSVSRATMREAVNILRERGVLDVQHGRGTYVRPQEEWTDIPTLITALTATMNEQELGRQLIAVRRMIEVGASGLAARNRTPDDIAALTRSLEEFDHAIAQGDTALAARKDMEFHEYILRASHNPFLMPLLTPLSEALQRSREDTTKRPQVRSQGRAHHHAILRTIINQDEVAAKDAMRQHMTQTARAFEDDAQDDTLQH